MFEAQGLSYEEDCTVAEWISEFHGCTFAEAMDFWLCAKINEDRIVIPDYPLTVH